MAAASGARAREFLSPEGLRLDGRRAGEIRRLNCVLGTLHADGSAYVELGNTKVLARVSGPREASARMRGAALERAQLAVDFASVPFASGQYKPQSRADRTSVDIAAAVRRTFEPVVQTQLYPRSQIEVSLTLLQADGGVRAAAINATTLALIDAGVALSDLVCACSAGMIGTALLLDLSAQVTRVRALSCVHPATCGGNRLARAAPWKPRTPALLIGARRSHRRTAHAPSSVWATSPPRGA